MKVSRDYPAACIHAHLAACCHNEDVVGVMEPQLVWLDEVSWVDWRPARKAVTSKPKMARLGVGIVFVKAEKQGNKWYGNKEYGDLR